MASSSPPSNSHPFSGLEDVVEEDAAEAAGENGRLMPVAELKPIVAKTTKENFKDTSFNYSSPPPEPKVKARKFTQILAVLAVSFGCYITGTTVVYPAVFIPGLVKDNCTSDNATFEENEEGNESNSTDSIFPDTLPFCLFNSGIAFIVSISSLGMLIGSLVAGPMANLVGRKWTCILGTCLSLSFGYGLIPFAQALWMILMGRFLMGAGLGFSMTTSTLYIMEISTPSMRSGLAVIPAVAGTLGLLSCQCLGAILEWRSLSIVLAFLNVPFFLMLIFLPETPVYLITTEQIERAHKVLRTMRGKRWDVTKELTDIKCASEGVEKYHVTVSDFLATTVLKPFLMSLALMFFFQFSGINIVMQYTVLVFKEAQSSIDEFRATILVGVALLASNIITLVVANRMPRRLMLLLSSFGVTVTNIIMGVYFYLKTLEEESCRNGVTPAAEPFFSAGNNGGNLNEYSLSTGKVKMEDGSVVSSTPQPALEFHSSTPSPLLPTSTDCVEIYTGNLGWLPLVLLMVYIFTFNLGYGSMIWITVAEILPARVRSVANSLSVAFTCVMSFLTSHSFQHLMGLIRGEGVFWLYGSFSLVGFLFILIFVPETKNKTEAEIQSLFLPKSQRAATTSGPNHGQQQSQERKRPNQD